ncbi:helix-hairpin-helix domain-containing protein [Carboxydochorda subterranea]|uniref:DNA polymerase beta n=1 Tax=Carboxydichorda subterranea TaxID=3109565 RepID=A0ABZ1C3U2_9FIRM|nr:helix-hairpin-helix domain-containing protein [Limnochorda sp. L945t]WRP18703.1 helix-hairpin-helix domain-containing protein [Limnochorda sp. L945t]
MKNLELAAQFDRIASLLEVLSESPFKIRAYRRIARTLLELPEPIEDVAREGRLREIPGVGDAIAGKIEEYLSTGRIGLLERLKQQIPEGVLELMAIPGIGARTARLLYEQLGVASLAELEAAARAGRIRQLKGMGQRSEAAILEGIQQWHRQAGLHPMPYVLGPAEALAAAVQKLPGVARVDLAGAVRRAEEMAEQAELVVAAADVAGATGAIRVQLGAEALLQPGPWPGTLRVSGPVAGGVTAEVLVVPPEAYAAALFFRTGPARHVEQVSERLADRGWRWEGLRLVSSLEPEREGASVRDPSRAPASEPDMYRLAGLPWIPPELRWGEDEVERAARGELPPRLVEVSDIVGDLHTHTVASDGVATPEEMVEGARASGLRYLAVTDHSPSLTIARGLTVERLRAHRQHLRALSERTGFPLLTGAEVDIRPDGTLDYPDDVLASLDWVVASIHSHFRLDEAAQTRRLLAACEHPAVKVLGHPTGRLLGRREGYPVDLEAVLDRAAETGTAVEINASPDRLDLSARWARRARALGVRIVVSTDAHSPAQLGFLRYGVLTARHAGLAPDDLLNTRPLEELIQSVKPHR